MTCKIPVHTTLSADATKILDRYTEELGAKNLVLEEALFALEEKRSGKKRIEERKYIKISTGSKVLDALFARGIPAGSSVLVNGCSGSGKTPVALNAINSAMNQGKGGIYEKCFLITTMKVDELGVIDHKFGFNLVDHSKEGRLRVVNNYNPADLLEYAENDLPVMIVLDDMAMLLGTDTSLDNFIRSLGWNLLMNFIKRTSAVLIMTTTDKDQPICSAFNTVLEMDRAEIANRSFSTIKVVKSLGLSNQEQVIKITFNRGYLNFVNLKTEEIAQINREVIPVIASSVVKEQIVPVKDGGKIRKPIEKGIKKPIEVEIVEILFSQQKIILKDLAKNLAKVGYSSRASTNAALNRLETRGIIIEEKLKGRTILLNNQDRSDVNKSLQEMFLENMSPIRKAIVGFLMKRGTIGREYLVSLMSEKYDRRAVLRSIVKMTKANIIEVEQNKRIKEICLSRSFYLSKELD